MANASRVGKLKLLHGPCGVAARGEGRAHQLAGHAANLEFWSGETAHALDVLDGYKSRFERLAAAQKSYVAAHQTTEFELDDVWGETAKRPLPPRGVPDSDRSRARRELCEGFYRFIVRCCTAGLIEKAAAHEECERHDISVGPGDFERRRR